VVFKDSGEYVAGKLYYVSGDRKLVSPPAVVVRLKG
jgi:hypothetical protein